MPNLKARAGRAAIATITGLVCAVCAAPAAAQSEPDPLSLLPPPPIPAPAPITRADLERILADHVLCYYPDRRFSCAWTELYTTLASDHVLLISGSARSGDPMEVTRFRLEWSGDALCIPFETQGVEAIWIAPGYRFSFDMAGLTEQGADLVTQRQEEYRTDAPAIMCFTYSHDPQVEGQILQHVFRDGVEDTQTDPIALIPLLANGLAVRPG